MTLSNVQIEQSKLDNLAMKVFAVSGEPPKHTVDEMAQILDYVAHHQVTPSGTLSISQNGQYDVTEYATADVQVPTGNEFLVTVSFNSSADMWLADKTYAELYEAYTEGKTIVWETGYLAEVATVAGEFHSGSPPYFSYYVRAIPTQGSVQEYGYELSASSLVQTAYNHYFQPSGTKTISAAGNTDVTNYATANVPAGSATAPATISGTSATVSTGTNTLTLSKTVSVTPTVSAGYVSSGTSGNSAVSLTASVTTKAAATITPGTTNQTIASGTYLTGTQTISGDANLVAGNIKSGTTIFGVTGTYSGGGSSKNIQVNSGSNSVRNNGYISTGHSLTVAKTGTYKVSWTAWRSSSSGTMGTNLHRNSSSGTNQQTWTNTYGQHIVLSNQSYTAGDVLTLYATSGSTSRYCWVAGLTIEEQ